MELREFAIVDASGNVHYIFAEQMRVSDGVVEFLTAGALIVAFKEWRSAREWKGGH